MAWDQDARWARSDDASKLPQWRADKLRALQKSVRQLPDEKLSPALQNERKPLTFR
jgi:hypothetical protein